MILASHEVHLQRGLLFVGSGTDPCTGLPGVAPGPPRPAVGSPTFVQVRTRSQEGPVRVRLWAEDHPLEGESVFEGEITLVTGRVSIYDFDDLFVIRQRFAAPGTTHPVSVRVDDPGQAARVDVILAGGSHLRTLTSVAGRELAPVALTDEKPFDPIREIGLILSSHDIPMDRLAAAVKVVLLSGGTVPFLTRELAAWLRLVDPAAREESAKRLSGEVEAAARAFDGRDVDERALGFARAILTEFREGR